MRHLVLRRSVILAAAFACVSMATAPAVRTADARTLAPAVNAPMSNEIVVIAKRASRG